MEDPTTGLRDQQNQVSGVDRYTYMLENKYR